MRVAGYVVPVEARAAGPACFQYMAHLEAGKIVVEMRKMDMEGGSGDGESRSTRWVVG